MLPTYISDLAKYLKIIKTILLLENKCQKILTSEDILIKGNSKRYTLSRKKGIPDGTAEIKDKEQKLVKV